MVTLFYCLVVILSALSVPFNLFYVIPFTRSLDWWVENLRSVYSGNVHLMTTFSFYKQQCRYGYGNHHYLGPFYWVLTLYVISRVLIKLVVEPESKNYLFEGQYIRRVQKKINGKLNGKINW